METSRGDRAGVLGYVVALIGVACFVIGCSLPFLGAAQPGSEVSLYRLLTGSRGGVVLGGALLILFGGVAVVALVAIIGIARRGSRGWAPRALGFTSAAWAMTWIGYLLETESTRSLSPLSSREVGYWAVLAGVVVVASGAILANVAGGETGDRARPVSAGEPKLDNSSEREETGSLRDL